MVGSWLLSTSAGLVSMVNMSMVEWHLLMTKWADMTARYFSALASHLGMRPHRPNFELSYRASLCIKLSLSLFCCFLLASVHLLVTLVLHFAHAKVNSA
jgi:disulfide bond formation protein DsbB